MQFAGRLEAPDGSKLSVHVSVNDDRIGLRSGAHWFGSWSLSEVTIERTTLFRFRLTVEGEEFLLVPEDPAGFSEATNAMIDLRAPSRFGLAQRLGDSQASAR